MCYSRSCEDDAYWESILCGLYKRREVFMNFIQIYGDMNSNAIGWMLDNSNKFTLVGYYNHDNIIFIDPDVDCFTSYFEAHIVRGKATKTDILDSFLCNFIRQYGIYWSSGILSDKITKFFVLSNNDIFSPQNNEAFVGAVRSMFNNLYSVTFREAMEWIFNHLCQITRYLNSSKNVDIPRNDSLWEWL